MSELTDYEAAFDRTTKVWMVYEILKDLQWHCRECEYTHTGITQIAGGSGIQGLQRGTKTRPGLVIESANHLCTTCDKMTRHDRWQGNFSRAIPGSSMPRGFVERAVSLLRGRDVVELTERPPNQLTVDHKVPQMRWSPEEAKKQTDYSGMSDDEIQDRFQLLKKSNGSVSHNLLKSRSCERCYRTGQRGAPFGIKFFYSGDGKWAPSDKQDPSGCIGCGWYDFDKWRQALNSAISRMERS